MNLESKPNFDEMSDEELDEFMEAWKEANEDLLWNIRQERSRPKTLMVNPAKVNQINEFLKNLGSFQKIHESKMKEEIEIGQTIIDISKCLSIDLKFSILCTMNQKRLHEMLIEMLKIADSVEISGMIHDYVKLSFLFENYYIELPNPPKA